MCCNSLTGNNLLQQYLFIPDAMEGATSFNWYGGTFMVNWGQSAPSDCVLYGLGNFVYMAACAEEYLPMICIK